MFHYCVTPNNAIILMIDLETCLPVQSIFRSGIQCKKQRTKHQQILMSLYMSFNNPKHKPINCYQYY